MADILGRHSINNIHIIEVDTDPSVGGTPAPKGSLASAVDVGAIWVKTGDADIDWQELSTFAGVSASAPLSGDGTTGSPLSLPAADTDTDGFLTSVDWNTFSSKEEVLSFSGPLSRSVNTISIPKATALVDGYLSSVDFASFAGKENPLSFSGPLSRSGDVVSIPAASSSQNGYLSSADWSTFNSKLSTVVANAPITGSGTTGSPLAMAKATASVNGYLAATDFAVFAGKENALSFNSPLERSVNTISISKADATSNGYLSKEDWAKFNSKEHPLTFVAPLQRVVDGLTGEHSIVAPTVVVGPSSAIDNRLARFDGTTGKLIQSSDASLTDSGDLLLTGSLSAPQAAITTLLVGDYAGSTVDRITIERKAGSSGMSLAVLNESLQTIAAIGPTGGLYGSSLVVDDMYGGTGHVSCVDLSVNNNLSVYGTSYFDDSVDIHAHAYIADHLTVGSYGEFVGDVLLVDASKLDGFGIRNVDGVEMPAIFQKGNIVAGFHTNILIVPATSGIWARKFVAQSTNAVSALEPGDLRVASAGSVRLWLEADTDNVTEADVPYIYMSQDANTVYHIIGGVGNANERPDDRSSLPGALANALYIGSSISTGGIQFGGHDTIHMTLRNTSGNLGIGTNNPGTRLAVVGLTATSSYNNVRVDTATGNFYYQSSSGAFKENIRDLDEEGAEPVLRLRPRRFDLVEEAGGAKDQVGLVMEEVAEDMPEALNRNSQGEATGVDFDVITTRLIQVVKRQEARIQALERRLGAA